MQLAKPGTTVRLRPGGRGDFVVRLDGRLVWDKQSREHRFPEPEEILARWAG